MTQRVRRGRPLYALGLLGALWVTARATMLWPDADVAGANDVERRRPSWRVASIAGEQSRTTLWSAPVGSKHHMPFVQRRPAAFAVLAPARDFAETQPVAAPEVSVAATPISRGAASVEPRHERSEWSASGWLLVRGGGGSGLVPAPSLGGDQIGARIAWTPVNGAGFSGFVRAAAPLRGAGREVTVGVEWQPGELPVRLVAEHRFAADRGIVGGPGLAVVGGVYDVALGAGFAIDAYGQAGVIARRRSEPYADGSLRVARAISDSVSVGVGSWAGAQRGVERLDIGPTVAIAMPGAGGRWRLSADWRHRVAGNARPGSGPALTLGADF